MEKISKKQLDELERELDRLWEKVGIDIEFTRHFIDRVNDSRNKKQITIEELQSIFHKTFQKHGKKIANNVFKVKTKEDIQAVLEDLNSNLNIPFVLKWDERKSELELVSKTVMRKKNFKTPNKTYKVERKMKTFKEFMKEDRTLDLIRNKLIGNYIIIGSDIEVFWDNEKVTVISIFTDELKKMAKRRNAKITTIEKQRKLLGKTKFDKITMSMERWLQIINL